MNLCIWPLAHLEIERGWIPWNQTGKTQNFVLSPFFKMWIMPFLSGQPLFSLALLWNGLVSSTLVVAAVVQQFAQHYEFEYCPPGDCTEIFPSIFAVLCLAYTLPLLENQCCHTKDHSRPFVQTALQDHNWISWFTMPMQVDSSDDKSFGSLSHCLNIFNHVWNQS